MYPTSSSLSPVSSLDASRRWKTHPHRRRGGGGKETIRKRRILSQEELESLLRGLSSTKQLVIPQTELTLSQLSSIASAWIRCTEDLLVVDLHGCPLQDSGARILARGIEASRYGIRTLDLSDTGIHEGLEDILVAFVRQRERVLRSDYVDDAPSPRHFSGVESLSVARNPLDGSQLSSLFSFSFAYPSLTSLDLTDISIGASYVHGLEHLLSESKSLRTLNLAGSLSTWKSALRFCHALERNTSIRNLNVSRNQIWMMSAPRKILDPEFAEQNELTGLGPLPLLTSLRTSLVKPSKRDEDGSNIVLESVLVQDCSFKAFGIESLLGNEMISGYFRCRRLDLRRNRLDDTAAKILRSYLTEDEELTDLILDENLLTHVGISHLTQGLRRRGKRLHLLSLRHNDIRDLGLQHLARALHAGLLIDHLDLVENNISSGLGYKILSDALTVNSSLEYIDLRGNEMKEENIVSLCKGAAKSSSLQFLGIISEQLILNDACTQAMLNALRDCSSLSNFGSELNGSSMISCVMRSEIESVLTDRNSKSLKNFEFASPMQTQLNDNSIWSESVVDAEAVDFSSQFASLSFDSPSKKSSILSNCDRTLSDENVHSLSLDDFLTLVSHRFAWPYDTKLEIARSLRRVGIFTFEALQESLEELPSLSFSIPIVRSIRKVISSQQSLPHIVSSTSASSPPQMSRNIPSEDLLSPMSQSLRNRNCSRRFSDWTRVCSDYHSSVPEQLSVKQGQLVRIVERTHSDQWLVCSPENDIGFVPVLLLQELTISELNSEICSSLLSDIIESCCLHAEERLESRMRIAHEVFVESLLSSPSACLSSPSNRSSIRSSSTFPREILHSSFSCSPSRAESGKERRISRDFCLDNLQSHACSPSLSPLLSPTIRFSYGATSSSMTSPNRGQLSDSSTTPVLSRAPSQDSIHLHSPSRSEASSIELGEVVDASVALQHLFTEWDQVVENIAFGHCGTYFPLEIYGHVPHSSS